MNPGEGERLYRKQRARFWKIIGGLALVGGLGGFATGFALGYADGSGVSLPENLVLLASAGVVLTAVLAAYGSWRFFVTVDEVELADNLWGSLIGFYVYVIAWPSWWALAKLDAAPEPDQWAIFVASMAAATIAYAYRKWRAR